MNDAEDLYSWCFDTNVTNDMLVIRMLGISQECLELRNDWHLFALNGRKGPFQRIQIDLISYPVVNSAFIAGAIELRNHFFMDPSQKIELLNSNERIKILIKIMNLFSFFHIGPLKVA